MRDPTARPRERIIRRAIAKPERVVVKQPRPFRPRFRPTLLLPIGFLVIILIGSLLLTLPMTTRAGEPVPFDVALFTATSAVCVTGLVVVDTGTYWSGVGLAIILILVQIGGLGFMTVSTFLLILMGRRVGMSERMLLGSSHGLPSIGGILRFTQQTVLITVLIEAAGALILATRFSTDAPFDAALWQGVFYSISAFNNAGFDTVGNFQSLIPYRHDPIITLTIAAQVVLGGLGFVALFNIANQRSYRYYSWETKLVLQLSLVLIVAGALGFLITEYDNPSTFGPMSLPGKLFNAFFMSVSPRSMGFSTINVAEMSQGGILLTSALMYIGGAAGSAAGGIKINTLGVLLAALASSVRGKVFVTAFGREIPTSEVSRAMSLALLALGLIFTVTLLMTLTDGFTLTQTLFETISAFGTVGLTMGITPDLSLAGRLLMILGMFLGRLGPLTVALALAQRKRPEPYRYPEADVKIG